MGIDTPKEKKPFTFSVQLVRDGDSEYYEPLKDEGTQRDARLCLCRADTDEIFTLPAGCRNIDVSILLEDQAGYKLISDLRDFTPDKSCSVNLDYTRIPINPSTYRWIKQALLTLAVYYIYVKIEEVEVKSRKPSVGQHPIDFEAGRVEGYKAGHEAGYRFALKGLQGIVEEKITRSDIRGHPFDKNLP